MANAVSGATNNTVIAQVQSTQNSQVSKITTNSSPAPQDKVTISQAGQAAQQANQAQNSGDTDQDGGKA